MRCCPGVYDWRTIPFSINTSRSATGERSGTGGRRGGGGGGGETKADAAGGVWASVVAAVVGVDRTAATRRVVFAEGLLPRGGRGRCAPPGEGAEGAPPPRFPPLPRPGPGPGPGVCRLGASSGGRLPLGRGRGRTCTRWYPRTRRGASLSRLSVSRGPPGAPGGLPARRARFPLPRTPPARVARRSRRAVPAAIAAVDPTVVSARARDGGDDGIAAAEAEAAASKVRRDGVGVDDTGTREGRAGAGDPGGGGGGRRGRRRAHQTAGGASHEHERGGAMCPDGPRAR